MKKKISSIKAITAHKPNNFIGIPARLTGIHLRDRKYQPLLSCGNRLIIPAALVHMVNFNVRQFAIAFFCFGIPGFVIASAIVLLIFGFKLLILTLLFRRCDFSIGFIGLKFKVTSSVLQYAR
jgi:hypothetical protein